jgi:3-dehydroquinate synthetase
VPTGDAALSLQERVRRLVADAGFHAEALTIATGERGVSDAARLPEYLELLAAHHLTQDDALVAVGNQAFLATWNHVAALWGQGMWYAGVATSLPALITACATPAGLTCGEVPHMVRAHTRMSLNYTAPSICAGFAAGEEQDLARALMVATAACESNESLKSLVSASEALAAGDVTTTASCALEAARSRGRVVSSTSAAVRNSLAYGTTLAAALAPEVPASEGRLLAEGMRFAARLAVGMEIGQMDFVYLQDGLLGRLGLHEVPFDVDPKVLVDRMKALVFARKNKFMFCVPFAPGRIRPQAVEDALLLEFVTAFCDARRALC